MTSKASYPQPTRVARLMALLLAVLLVVSLPGHAVMDDSCAIDCGAPQVEMVDHSSADCGACAALTAAPVLPCVPPDVLADFADPAVIEFIASPPRYPPRT